jgi:predicted nucleic acid-binding protein
VIALDASVLVAHLSPHDAHHHAATGLLRDAAGERLIAHDLTLAEVLVGGARIGREEQMLADLRAAGVQHADRPEGEPLRLARLRARTGLKLPDCCVLDAALGHAASLATFNRTLVTAAQQVNVEVLTAAGP